MFIITAHVDIHLHFTVLCILVYSFSQWFIATLLCSRPFALCFTRIIANSTADQYNFNF